MYKSGQSYFLQKRGGRMVEETFDHAWVSGSFKKSFTAHAGTANGHEYVCAYLDGPKKYGGYRITVARASGRHTVTK